MATSSIQNNIDVEQINRITQLKLKMGKQLILLGHYYQRLPIALLSDHLGDSYGLSALAANTNEAEFIVFCGVEFMAESAEILRSKHQTVFHPNSDAGCPMSDMADAIAIERTFVKAQETLKKKIIPIAYMNTSADIKAFCGRNSGLICTSSNATKAFQWAYDRGDVVFFIPDEHLGTNTADALKIPMHERALFDPFRSFQDNESLLTEKTRLLLWKGYCHVHTWFTPEHLRVARQKHPEAQIIVHPECPREVVALADYSGSTAFMHRFVKEADPGSTLIVGTEMNMIDFLQHQFGREKTILPLSRSFCPNMFKISLSNLIETLENLDNDRFRVRVHDQIKKDAKIALTRMLELT